jgi:Mg/Co/Ni transporter MgtE
MAERQIGRMPVVDAEQHVVGVLTLSSLILRTRDHEKVLDTAEEVARRSARVA